MNELLISLISLQRMLSTLIDNNEAFLSTVLAHQLSGTKCGKQTELRCNELCVMISSSSMETAHLTIF